MLSTTMRQLHPRMRPSLALRLLVQRRSFIIGNFPQLSTRRVPMRHSHLLPHLTRRFVTFGFVPRGGGSALFRLFWTTATAIFGYVYYKINQASSWLHEHTEGLRNWVFDTAITLVDIWSNVAGILQGAKSFDEGSSWNPLSWKAKASKPTPVDQGDGEKPTITGERTTESTSQSSNADNFKSFIKKMIEIRNILKTAEMDSSIHLPSIVVIGSQSSGKSSVLESIVGHTFLPKGNNMVTRRPLELTLVNCPTATRDYAVFTQLESGPVYDFDQVQKTLTELNLTVPENQWVSARPIELTIYSKNVPDLSLVDLPGYIQVNSKNQPPILRDKIAQLCEKYISQDNIILAVCAADVDLANAEALKASRLVDPDGHRTIGVVTKLDLVTPDYAKALINNDDYPLKLGYVGVVCRSASTLASSSSSALARSHQASPNDLIEDQYVHENQSTFDGIMSRVGIGSLRNRLTTALEASMSSNLVNVLENVRSELGELKYLLKVEYSDRTISPEGYLSYLTATLKQGLESVAINYNRAKVRGCLRGVLQDRLLSVVEQAIWPSSTINEDDLNKAVAMLTRSGVGRLAANALLESIIEEVRHVIKDGPLQHHPGAKERLLKQVELVMRSRCQNAIEQVENAIKPLKHDLEYTDEEWSNSRSKLLSLLAKGISKSEEQLAAIQKEIGPKRLRRIVQLLSSKSDDDLDRVNPLMISKAKEAVILNKRLKSLQSRKTALQMADCQTPDRELNSDPWLISRFNELLSFSSPSSSTTNSGSGNVVAMDEDGQVLHLKNPCQLRCPEVYLFMVMQRLLATASLYVHHELVHEFLHPIPGELASSLSLAASSPTDKKEIIQFINENPLVARHLHIQERLRILENVRDHLIYLQQLRPSPREVDRADPV